MTKVLQPKGCEQWGDVRDERMGDGENFDTTGFLCSQPKSNDWLSTHYYYTPPLVEQKLTLLYNFRVY